MASGKKKSGRNGGEQLKSMLSFIFLISLTACSTINDFSQVNLGLEGARVDCAGVLCL